MLPVIHEKDKTGTRRDMKNFKKKNNTMFMRF
jgi:hypothetical protein